MAGPNLGDPGCPGIGAERMNIIRLAFVEEESRIAACFRKPGSPRAGPGRTTVSKLALVLHSSVFSLFPNHVLPGSNM